MTLADFEPFGKDHIITDMQKIIKLWKSSNAYVKSHMSFIESMNKLHSEITEDYCLDIIDDKTGQTYTYDYMQDGFMTEYYLNGKFQYGIDEPGSEYRTDIPTHVKQYFDTSDKLTKNAHKLVETECRKMGYNWDYEDNLMYLFKDNWVVTMPLWCEDISAIIIEKTD